MKIACFRVLYISSVLLITADRACGLSNADVAAADDAKIVEKTPKRQLMGDADGKNNAEERMPEGVLPTEEVADNFVQLAGLTRSFAASSSSETALRLQPSSLISNVLELYRGEKGIVQMRLRALIKHVQAFKKDEPTASPEQVLNQFQLGHSFISEIDLALALDQAKKNTAIEPYVAGLKDALFKKLRDENIQSSDELRNRWKKDIEVRAQTPDALFIEAILADYGIYCEGN